MLNRLNRHHHGESEAHRVLKAEAIAMLREQGYEAFQEYWVLVGTRRFRVDVAGFKTGESIAIECGHTSYEKICELEKVFTKVQKVLYSYRLHTKTQVKFLHPDAKKQLVRAHIVPGNAIAMAKMFGRGVIQIPAEIRYRMDIRDEDIIMFYQDREGKIFIEVSHKPKKPLGTYR